jgi:hypothetical protein
MSIIKIVENFTTNVNGKEFKERTAELKEGEAIAIPIPFSITSSWLFDRKLLKDTLITLRVHVIDPTGKDLGGPEQEHALPSGIDKVNLNFKSDTLPITTSGKYRLQATLLNKTGTGIAEAEYPYEVTIQSI